MQPHVPDDRITSAKQFVTWAGDLQDSESVAAVKVIYAIQQKWAARPNTAQNLEEMRDETLTKLADIGILATFDPSPCFYGEPPIVEIIGKVAGDDQHKYGFDHERKEHEVKKATARGEDFLGQKESADATKAQKRAKKDD